MRDTVALRARSWLMYALLAGVGASACGEEPPADADAGVPDGGARDSGTPTPDPSLFDCTSREVREGVRLPRTSAVPLACALDPLCRTPQITGHRGAGGQLGQIAPEDTLAAYRAGIALGIEYLETDPRPTSDGVIVNMHDTDVDRTTDGTGEVLAMTFDEVRALRIETTLAGDFRCERVPTLQEILEVARDRAIVLVDANKTDRVDLLVQAILDADAIDTAVFDTSDVAKIDAALAIEPALHIMIRPPAEEITAQLDHFAPRVPVLVELVLGDVDVGAPIIHARGTRVFADVFGADVLFGVRENTTGYGSALDRGVDVLECDRPEAALRVLRERGLR